MLSINAEALTIAERMIAQAERLDIQVSHLACGARIIDAGINAPGSWQAGKLIAEISLGGLGSVEFMPAYFGADSPASEEAGFWLPAVRVVVDHPVIACLSSQYAGWGIRREGYFAIGSGPARARAAVEPLFQQLEYRDHGEAAVIILEGRQWPTDEVGQYIARKCHIAPSGLTMILAPASCLAGSFQLSARVVATGMHKMLYLGFDFNQVRHGVGFCPIAPVVPDEDLASCLSNDCVLYGGRVHYTMNAADEDIKALLERMPSWASPTYGTPFYQIYQQFGGFYEVDKLLFCPAEISINNLKSGNTFRAGKPHLGVLRRSLLGKEVVNTSAD
jgi:methenyltetrahydromethanopterin cyclohydrolase